MILVSDIGFSGMPDLVMWPQNTLDITLCVNHPIDGCHLAMVIKFIRLSTE